jgi:transcriptional regulator with XRE-family HTH domain
MASIVSATAQNFQSLCRQWRQFRKLSQLDLALAANVSQRHVSWLETGRSRPSREMVVRLSDAMDIPLRERNILLQRAGYSAAYRESPLDEPAMAPVLDAPNHVLQHHEPLPAVVVDRFWNVKKKNRAADLMLGIGGDPERMLENIGADGELNLALLTLHPQGLRPYISNWQQAAPSFIRRLKSEALASADPQLQSRLATYIELAGPMDQGDPVGERLLPVLPLELNINGLQLSLFSVISTFGTPQDITTDELRVEAFYPTDACTEEFFRGLASPG